MEQHRSLFKTNSSLLRDKTSNIKAANEIRAKQRRDLYSSTRNISPSPSPTRQSEQKENLQPPLTTKALKPEAAKPPCTAENEKSSRQKAYLMKYMAWKANKIKEEQAKKEQTKRPVFIPYGSGPANGTRNIKKSFAPKNHTFKPPSNLEDLTIDIVGQNKFRCASGNQQMTYNFVPTPKKENIQSRIAAMRIKNSKPISSKPLFLKPVSKPEISKPVVAPPPKPVTNVPKPASTASKFIPRNTTNGKVTRPPTTQPIVKPSLRSDTKTPAKPLSTTQHVSNTVTKSRIKPPPIQMPAKPLQKRENNIASKLKMLPPSQYNAKNVKKLTTTSKVASSSSKTVNAQSGLPPLKRPTFKASKKVGTSISNAFSTVNAKMNKKKSPDTDSKYLLPNLKTECIVSETPSDPNSLNTVFEFVTSTKRKSSSLKNSKVDLLFAADGNTMSPVDISAPARPDFIRYSIVQTDAEKTPSEEDAKPMKSADGECKKEEAVTPIKNVIENTTPTTYMSPYVSVSRGKVSTKIEREKRNSVYMGTENAVVPEKVALEHHTMATVRYYQKQLSEEVNRLNDQCRVWEEYKEANPQLGDAGGTDMIDVTIGQTKLLINKKLKQFGGLIDRCEEGLRSKKTTNNGDDESFLPVLPEDLDGFWSMVGLQIENVDKRFANIERWKANNWADPDEVPVQQANIRKTKKSKPTTTARPNQALQKMLKAAHAAYLKKKAVGDTEDDVILTPSKRQVLIKDRRSRSAAATVITVNTTKVKRISAEKNQVDLNQTPKFTPHHKGFRKSMNLLKSTLLGEQDRKSPADDGISSPNQKTSRKSILKTPGSVRRSKNVIFNSKALKFTIEDTLNDFNSDQEHDSEEDQRTYKLRNRRIILRDSAEFVIPK